jgi:hypothetical protein
LKEAKEGIGPMIEFAGLAYTLAKEAFGYIKEGAEFFDAIQDAPHGLWILIGPRSQALLKALRQLGTRLDGRNLTRLLVENLMDTRSCTRLTRRNELGVHSCYAMDSS